MKTTDMAWQVANQLNDLKSSADIMCGTLKILVGDPPTTVDQYRAVIEMAIVRHEKLCKSMGETV